jgi:hypothetical protein
MQEGKELTPAKSCLDRGHDHRVKMTTHELHTHRSIFATELQIPKLAPTGRSGSCLPSAFMRTVGEPDERSRVKTVPTIGVVGTCTQDWRGVRSLVRPQGDTQTRTDDADATVSPVNPSCPGGTGGEFASALAFRLES